MKCLVLTTCLLSLLIVGAGCSSKPQTTAPTTTLQVVIKKKPNTADIKIQAQNFCEAKDYELIIRFDKTTQSSKSFCRFKDSSECEAVEFFTGKCVPGSKDKITKTPSPAKASGMVACTSEYDPVCGADGLNYTNSCIAQAQGVKIAYDGVCIDKNKIKPPVENSKVVSAKSPADEETVELKGIVINPENWLPIIKDMILVNPPSDPPAFIEKCYYGGKETYYRSDGCSKCFSILYDSGGTPLCYPNNDVADDCPSYFDKNQRSEHCTRVWQDPR